VRRYMIDNKVPGFVTKGDANKSPDVPIPAGLIKGRAIWHAPHLGQAMNWVKTPIGLALLIYIPALVVVTDELKRLAAYYKSREGYISPLLLARRRKQAPSRLLPSVIIAVSVLVGALLWRAGAALAALQSTVTLSNNVLATAGVTPPPPPTGGILLVDVQLRCGTENTATTNADPYIQIYNNSAQTVSLAGWTVQDNNGVIATLPADADLAPGHRWTLNLTGLSTTGNQGLQYAGDRLTLLNASNQNIDSLSWSADTSIFNPSVQSMQAGSDAARTPQTTDTNTAADWQVAQRGCP
ncbi:MAG: Signal peptidase, partial [Candidatus Saccharibacteria bacterium]|nr:Signal peptidase [Candidatus Saccharibacteria bacterium]